MFDTISSSSHIILLSYFVHMQSTVQDRAHISTMANVSTYHHKELTFICSHCRQRYTRVVHCTNRRRLDAMTVNRPECRDCKIYVPLPIEPWPWDHDIWPEFVTLPMDTDLIDWGIIEVHLNTPRARSSINRQELVLAHQRSD